MSHSYITHPATRLQLAASWIGLLTSIAIHCLAFGSVLFQFGWILPVYADVLASARHPLPANSIQAIQISDYFSYAWFQWSLLGALTLDIVILIVFFYRAPAARNLAQLYAMAIPALVISFLLWNNIALCLGIARL